MTAAIDLNKNVKRIQHAAPLSVEMIFRPKGGEILKRNTPIQKDKLQGEGAPSEVKVVLSWEINTRKFTIHLPIYKHIAWGKTFLALAKILRPLAP